MSSIEYDCHRKYLSDYLEFNDLTFRDFARQTNGIVSISALSQFLKRDRSGEFLQVYSFKLDTWAALLSLLRISQDEFDHLLLIKIKADLTAHFHPKSGQISSINRIIQRGTINKNNGINSEANLSEKALSIASIYDLLPRNLKSNLIIEVERLSDYFLAGQKKSSKLSGIKKYLKKLEH